MRTLLLALTLCACGGLRRDMDAGPTDAGPITDPDGGSDAGLSPWLRVQAAVQAASADAGVLDLALYVFDGDTDARVYALELGNFRSGTNIAVASASKWISAMVIFDVIRRGQLSLDSTTGSVLGWTGPNAGITLKQLLSFTSGLDPDQPCTANPLTTLSACVNTISGTTAVADAGTRFDYGSTHLHVAARMAEVATSMTWDQLFDEVLRTPLQLSSTARYYTFPMQSTGVQNPLVAGGLRATTDEYGKLLALEYHQGVLGSVTVGTTALFDAQAIEPFSVVIGASPAANVGYPNMHYGLSAWLECATPLTGCLKVSSPGAFGFTPWVDRDKRYYGIVAMQVSGLTGGVVKFSIDLEQVVQPLIITALGR